MLAIINSYIFFLFLTTLVLSNNLVLFFISWVGLNISLYGILLKSFNSYNKEMTLKYFISGSLITIFMLVSLLIYFMDYFSFNYITSSYNYLNTENLSQTKQLLTISKTQKIFYSIIVGSLLFKLGAFPFHFYLSDMYQTLNTKETMFLYTVALKVSIFFTLLKILTSFWYLNYIITDILICSGLGSVFVSSFSILKQYKLSKFWAYSYLNSIGYILISISSGIGSEISEISFYPAKVYFFTYLLVWLGILDFISKISIRTGKSSILKNLYYISDLTYLSYNSKLSNLIQNENKLFEKNNLSYYFSILIVSLMGLPPTIGFFSKSIVYFDAISNNNSIIPLIFLIFFTPFIAYAYLKLIIYSIFLKINNNINSKFKKKISNVIFLEKNENNIINFKIISKILIILPILVYICEKLNYLNWVILQYLNIV